MVPVARLNWLLVSFLAFSKLDVEAGGIECIVLCYSSKKLKQLTDNNGFTEILAVSVLNSHFSRWTWVSQYQHVSTLDCVRAKGDGDGGDNGRYKTCKAPVKVFYRPDALPVSKPSV